jgi:hypothetical protein
MAEIRAVSEIRAITVLYPLHYMLRKREWKWGEVEEEAWTLAKQLSGMGLKLTIPDSTDDLVVVNISHF